MKLRQRPKVTTVPLFEELGPEMNEAGEVAEPVADWSGLARDELERKELVQKIEEAAQRLPPEYRTVFILLDVEGLSAEEARQILNLSLPALKTRLHRARLFLRKELADTLKQHQPTSSIVRGTDAKMS